MLLFIHAKAEAPPIGFDGQGMLAMARGALGSSDPDSILLGSHRNGTFSIPPAWLFRLVSPDDREGAGS